MGTLTLASCGNAESNDLDAAAGDGSAWETPAVVTLGTTSILTGIALLITKGAPITGVPQNLIQIFGSGSFVGIPVSVLIGLLIFGAMAYFMTRTPSGRAMYAVGGNREAARVAGIKVPFTTVQAFVICSVLAAIAGFLLTARLGSGEASVGASYVMMSIAAAVLGGTSLFGGEGSPGKVLLGVIFLGILGNGMNLLHVSSYIQEIVIGFVLISAVAIERLREKR